MQGKGLKAIPFSDPPAELPQDMVGYVGFDPLGFSTLFDIKFLREAELKHGQPPVPVARPPTAQSFCTCSGAQNQAFSCEQPPKKIGF